MVLGMMALALGLSGCGTEGPMGPMGPAGPAGVTMIAEDEYLITAELIDSYGKVTLNYPELLNRSSSTFVQVYWAYPDSSDTWQLLPDGNVDGTTTQNCAVSWSLGKVYLYNMLAGDKILVKVFEHN